MNDTLEDMIRDILVDAFKKARVGDNFQRDMEESLYLGCKKSIRLWAMLRLFNLKARGVWIDKRFTKLLK